MSPVALPGAEVMINRAPGGKALGQIAPLAGGLGQVENGVEQFPVAVLAGPPRRARLGKTIGDQGPFTVSQIGGITHPQFVKVRAVKSKLTSKFSQTHFSNRL